MRAVSAPPPHSSPEVDGRRVPQPSKTKRFIVPDPPGGGAAELGAPPAVLTFEPHPADFFAGRPVVFRLSAKAIKARALAPLDLDGVVILTFDASLASLTAEAFVADVLVARLGVAAVVIGWDF